MEKVAEWDALIVGGGCNGTGLARDLSLRGAKVLLCEKDDFARGATGASSAMIHGGPRYLLADVQTTKHSCEDSGFIQQICPHLVFRIPFLFPLRKQHPFGRLAPLLHQAYFDLYDVFAAAKHGIPHTWFDPQSLQQIQPGLRGDFFGAIALDEWGIDPARLCVLNAKDAFAHGASILLQTKVQRLLRDETGKIRGAVIQRQGFAPEQVLSKCVINCAGAEIDPLLRPLSSHARIRPGKGVHLIYARQLSPFAIITEAIDGRQVFTMPYQNETWIGTTDTDHYGEQERVEVTADEIHYLEEAGAAIVPGLAQQRLIGVRVGYRNTIYGWGIPEDGLSRRFDVYDHAKEGAPGLWSMLGGKLASYRIQAETTADAVSKWLGLSKPCRTHQLPLPGSERASADLVELGKKYQIPQAALARMYHRHGCYIEDILTLGEQLPNGFQVVDPCEPVLECELRYIIRNEWVERLGMLLRRCRLTMGPDMGLQSALRAAEIYAEERQLTYEAQEMALAELLWSRWELAAPVVRGQQAQAAALLWRQFGTLLQQAGAQHGL